jgi:drug/metabolite transporter (DMT)-like permease
LSDRHDIGRGIGFAVLAFALFSFSDAFVKWLAAAGYSVFQLSTTFALFALLPVAWLVVRAGGLKTLKARRPLWVGARAALLAADTLCAYYAFARLPFAETYAIFFGTPMLVTALSVPLLGEKVGWRRWAAVVVGFMGVMIVLRPGFAELGAGHAAAIFAMVLFALSLLMLRRIGGEESSAAMLSWVLLALFLVSAPLVPAVFVMPGAVDLVLMAAGGLLLGIAHVAIIEAFRAAPASAVSPFHYSQMIWAVLLGLFVFDELPDFWVAIGSAVIVGSGLFILWREKVVSGARRGRG